MPESIAQLAVHSVTALIHHSGYQYNKSNSISGRHRKTQSEAGESVGKVVNKVFIEQTIKSGSLGNSRGGVESVKAITFYPNLDSSTC